MGLFRKLLRRTFFTGAALSILLLLATLILWPVSYYWSVHAMYFTPQGNQYALGGFLGRMTMSYYTVNYPSYFCTTIEKILPRPGRDWSYLTWNTPSRIDWNGDLDASTTLGVISYREHLAGRTLADLSIPCSYLALLFSILPLFALRSLRRQRKLARVGLCPNCRYDLRAHPPGSTCPECGTPVRTP